MGVAMERTRGDGKREERAWGESCGSTVNAIGI